MHPLFTQAHADCMYTGKRETRPEYGRYQYVSRNKPHRGDQESVPSGGKGMRVEKHQRQAEKINKMKKTAPIDFHDS